MFPWNGDLSGQVFGQLTVKERAQVPHKGRYKRWVCQCACGEIVDTPTTNTLRSGVTTSCGCVRREKLAASKRGRPYGALYNNLLRSASASTSTRKVDLVCDLSYDEFVEFTKQRECHYCGEALIWHAHSPQLYGETGYHLDRKDNKRGYTKDNLVPCCTDCNYAKAARYSYEEWVAMTKALRTIRQQPTSVFIS